jgi:hypothetical protein
MSEPAAESLPVDFDMPLLQLVGALGAPNARDEDAAADERSYRQFVEALGVAHAATVHALAIVGERFVRPS